MELNCASDLTPRLKIGLSLFDFKQLLVDNGIIVQCEENSFKGLNIDCVQYSNIIRITYYSYSYSGTILNPNIIRIRIRPNICARILFVFVFAHSEKTNIIRICMQSKF